MILQLIQFYINKLKMQTVLVVFAIGFIFGAIGAYIAEKKGRSHYEGFFLGFLFGLLGVIAEIFLPKKSKEN